MSQLTGIPEQPWPDWVIWYATTDLEPPPGFRTWKGRIYSRIDEEFPSFFREDAPSQIRVEEIVWGGVALDGIPALVNARMLPAAEADYITPTELVFGVEINGDARAYPLRILDWHEMANDVVGGVPVALAYCTLCGAGVLFDTRVGDATYEFGSSGFLMRSNKLMYDRTTYTLWNQLTGEPVLGKLADGSIELKRLPVVVTRWQAWLERHPETQVLSLQTGHLRDYTPGNPYGGYFASPETMFPAEGAVDRLPDKARHLRALHQWPAARSRDRRCGSGASHQRQGRRRGGRGHCRRPRPQGRRHRSHPRSGRLGRRRGSPRLRTRRPDVRARRGASSRCAMPRADSGRSPRMHWWVRMDRHWIGWAAIWPTGLAG